jgi:uncharacterized protein
MLFEKRNNKLVNKELVNLSSFFVVNKNEIAVLTFTTLFLTLANYYSLWTRWSNSLVYYAILPIIVVLLVLRKSPRDFGLAWGDIRTWSLHVVIACIVAIPVLLFVSRIGSFQSYYYIKDFNLWIYFLENCAYLLGWEYIFRGFILFGLRDRLKEGSILVQMIPFVLLHFGKPELETLSTIVTGIYFGYVAYRGNSFWPAFFIHLFINVFFVAIVNLV